MLTEASMVGSSGDTARSLTDCRVSDGHSACLGQSAYIAMAYQRLRKVRQWMQ